MAAVEDTFKHRKKCDIKKKKHVLMLAAFNNAKDLTNVVKVNFQQVESVPIRVKKSECRPLAAVISRKTETL